MARRTKILKRVFRYQVKSLSVAVLMLSDSLTITNGTTKGEMIRPIISPRIAQIAPKTKPRTAKSSFMQITQIKPSMSQVKMRPGHLIDAEHI